MIRKNDQVELLRFLFAVFIMIFHAHNVNNGLGHPIPLGHVFVEFFFFLTGYFTYSHVENKISIGIILPSDTRYALIYTWKKIKRFIPYMLMTAIPYYIILFFVKVLRNSSSVRDVLREFSGAPFDLLLLQITGICKNPHFNAWWYLSSLLFVLPVITIVFMKSQFGGYLWVMHCAPVLIYGYFASTVDGVDWETQIGYVKSGFLRAFAGLCIGGVIYKVAKLLSERRIGKLNKIIISCMEVICYIYAILLAWKFVEIDNSVFFIIALLAVGLTITFSRISYWSKVVHPVFSKLGSMATPLYICHYSIGRLINQFIGDRACSISCRYLIYYAISFSAAIIMMKINNLMEKNNDR